MKFHTFVVIAMAFTFTSCALVPMANESSVIVTQTKNKMHYAYIVRTASAPNRFYYVSTADLKKRLAVHNAGGNVSTNPFRPWTLVWYGGFRSKEAAIRFEQYLKTASGKAFARNRWIPDQSP